MSTSHGRVDGAARPRKYLSENPSENGQIQAGGNRCAPAIEIEFAVGVEIINRVVPIWGEIEPALHAVVAFSLVKILSVRVAVRGSFAAGHSGDRTRHVVQLRARNRDTDGGLAFATGSRARSQRSSE